MASVPEKYHSEIEVFMKQDADQLPPHRPQDHDIQLLEGTTPPFARNYKPMTTQELEAVKKYLDENLGKGFIRPSSSPSAAPVLLVRKPGGGLRVCVDYRALNAITIRNRYPMPLIGEKLNPLCRASSSPNLMWWRRLISSGSKRTRVDHCIQHTLWAI